MREAGYMPVSKISKGHAEHNKNKRELEAKIDEFYFPYSYLCILVQKLAKQTEKYWRRLEIS